MKSPTKHELKIALAQIAEISKRVRDANEMCGIPNENVRRICQIAREALGDPSVGDMYDILSYEGYLKLTEEINNSF